MATDADEKNLDEGMEDSEETTDEMAERVVSDSRARRKRRRGEAVATGEAASAKKGRATPSRRKGEVKAVAASTAGVDNTPVVGGIIRYFKGVYAEMQKVTWPNQEETLSLTQVVLVVTIAFAVGLGLLDTFYTWWFNKAIEDNVSTFLIIAGIVSVIASGIVYLVFYRETDTVSY